MFGAEGRRKVDASASEKENGHLDADALEHFVDLKMLRVINIPDIVPKVNPYLSSTCLYLGVSWSKHETV